MSHKSKCTSISVSKGGAFETTVPKPMELSFCAIRTWQLGTCHVRAFVITTLVNKKRVAEQRRRRTQTHIYSYIPFVPLFARQMA